MPNKYKSGGIQEALFDGQRKGRPVEITDDSVSWIINNKKHIVHFLFKIRIALFTVIFDFEWFQLVP